MRIPDYEVIQELARDARYILYRGQSIPEQKPVLLKVPLRDPPPIADVARLEREFQMLGQLSVPGIPRAHQLLSHDGSSCLVLEDQGGTPLPTWLGNRRLDLDVFFKLAIQLATILIELHRQDIVHRNIHPRSLIVHSATGELWLCDMRFAARSSVETEALIPLYLIRDTLAYISPEQTGRMNRAIDYRTDFYSLGITYYELLTGRPPFNSDDPLELIHWHVARNAPAASELNPEIPEPLSRIVMKLLAKTAEERYQSALGLREDLDICARAWSTRRSIPFFPLGQRDISDRFLIPQKLYGRDQEVAELLAAFDRVCQGPASIMLVAGYSGIGKTSLVQELYKPIVRQRGYFIAGKFDQIVRNIPYGALIQALRGLVGQLLTESEDRLALWRARLSQALGHNGGVLAEVIPEIELIIGRQPPPVALDPTETLNRFQLVFQNFVGALAQRDHPLVVFLDDLQWADAATLSLLQPLLTNPDVGFLFLMGAYRDNEVDAAHPLARTLRTLESAGAQLHRLSLRPLELSELTLFIRDTFHGDSSDAEPLACLVMDKTAGNPFFVIQFLKTLKQEGFFEFNYELSRWTYRLEAIRCAAMTDNVIDLMTRKIQRLSPESQHALTLAACIGNPFDQHTLAIVSEQTPDATADDLKEAIDEGLIIPAARPYGSAEGSDFETAAPIAAYSFLHDRVQQAAYALIPDERKAPIHLAVGRLMLEHANLGDTEEKLFDIVHHLNLGSGLIADEAERVALARLNLSAGQKAKSSTAYEAALDHLSAGVRLLTEEQWKSDYDLTFDLHLEAAECQYLCGNFDKAEQQFAFLLQRAATSLDKARVYRLRTVQLENMSRYADALASAREGLGLFAVSFPDSRQEKQAALEREIESIQALLGQRRIESLIDLPVMTDPETRMVMNILTDIWSSAYILGDAILARLISATMVRLSLVHGNSEESAYGYVTHAITVGPVCQDYQSAYEFGRLALRVNEKFNDSKRRAKIHQQFHAHVNLWRRPMQTCIPHAQEACRSGLEAGDFLYAAYGASTESWPAMVSTQDLAQFVRDFSPNLALIKKLKITTFADALRLIMNWARALRGETRSPLSLSHEEFDEREYAETYRGNPFFTMFYAVAKLQLCYVLGEHREALEISRLAREIAYHLSGTMWPVIFDFWNGLTLAANYADATEDERRTYLEEMAKARKSLATLADNCAENFLCQSLLLSAEIERIAGRELSALDFYERAIGYAKETSMIQHQALANELCARFWLSRGQKKVATVFLAEARHCYARWGALAKVEELERRYDLRGRPADGEVTALETTTEAEAGALDLFSVMKAAQAIAGEIELEKLLTKLMRLVIENAGAERGHLILEHDGKAFVHAEGSLDTAEVKVHDAIPLNEDESLPVGIVNYVRRTSESVVLADAKNDDKHGNDPYIRRRQVRSILCTPVLHQSRLIGVLYLENNLTPDAFTPERINVMQMLASQAAISLENARLYEEMKQEMTSRRRAEEMLREITQGTASVTGSDFFYSLVRHLASALQVRYAFVSECRVKTKNRARSLAFWKGGSLGKNFEYDVADTPCMNVLAGRVSYYSEGLQNLFPKDRDLVELGAESYLGVPIFDVSGGVIGHLAVLDDKPMAEDHRRLSVLKIFAGRAGAELERLRAEESLRAALAEVELLRKRLEAENVYLQEEIRREHNFDEIVGNSTAILEALQKVERVAPTDSTVLIWGETGTGKELIARAIHNLSTRKDRPLVKVNCGAISAGLVESELFGHVKGAFTGAFDRRTGRFELAHGGTLFLDEVSELPVETQVKLLRVLQEGEFEPVGSSRTIRVDVRILAATNRNLEDAVRAGRFRSDLFYRLNVFPLGVPPLRERRSDIPQLAMFFLSRFAKKFGKKIEAVSQETLNLLANYSWPGNIRELQNIIERGVVLCQGPVLTLGRDLLPALAPVERSMASVSLDRRRTELPAASNSGQESSTLEEIERRHILAVLEQVGWVIEGPRGAAKILNLHPNTLRSRMKKLGIQRSSRAQ